MIQTLQLFILEFNDATPANTLDVVNVSNSLNFPNIRNAAKNSTLRILSVADNSCTTFTRNATIDGNNLSVITTNVNYTKNAYLLALDINNSNING